MAPTSSSRSVKKSTDTLSTRRLPQRRAFTLIELIIVILLMMLMFYIGASMLLPSFHKKPERFTPTNLKKTLLEATGGTQGTLLCTGEPCRTCYFRPDIQTPFEKIKAAIDLGKLQSFIVDANGHIKTLRFERYHDRPICLVMHFYPNGSSTPLIIQNEKGVYYIPSLFGSASRYDTLAKARDAWLKTKKQVLEERLY